MKKSLIAILFIFFVALLPAKSFQGFFDIHIGDSKSIVNTNMRDMGYSIKDFSEIEYPSYLQSSYIYENNTPPSIYGFSPRNFNFDFQDQEYTSCVIVGDMLKVNDFIEGLKKEYPHLSEEIKKNAFTRGEGYLTLKDSFSKVTIEFCDSYYPGLREKTNISMVLRIYKE